MEVVYSKNRQYQSRGRRRPINHLRCKRKELNKFIIISHLHFNNTNIGNYWDDYNGSDKNRDGIGDKSYIIPILFTITEPKRSERIYSTNVTVEFSGRDRETGIDHYEIIVDNENKGRKVGSREKRFCL